MFVTKIILVINKINDKTIEEMEEQLEKYGFDSQKIIDKAFNTFYTLRRIDFYSKNRETEPKKYHITVWGLEKNRKTLKPKKFTLTK